MRPVEILWVEDNQSEIALIRQAMQGIKIPYRLNFAYDGVQALDFLKHQGAFTSKPDPDLIMLDLNLPRKSGLEVLDEIKKDVKFRSLPVLIFSSSLEAEDLLKKYNLQNHYIPKPIDYNQFNEVARRIENFWINYCRENRQEVTGGGQV
jgi:chemotaxis family two-component system response regulator Rcp1